MKPAELHMEKLLLPFEDGSGYAIRVQMIRRDDGGATLRIWQGDAVVDVRSNDWPELRDTVDRLMDFMSAEPQSEANP